MCSQLVDDRNGILSLSKMFEINDYETKSSLRCWWQMKEIKKEVTIYVARDGKEFYTPFECKMHEDDLIFRSERANYLSRELSEYFAPHFGEGYRIKVNYLDLSMIIELFTGNIWREPEYELNFDSTSWDYFVFQVKVRFGYEIKAPSYYWVK